MSLFDFKVNRLNAILKSFASWLFLINEPHGFLHPIWILGPTHPTSTPFPVCSYISPPTHFSPQHTTILYPSSVHIPPPCIPLQALPLESSPLIPNLCIPTIWTRMQCINSCFRKMFRKSHNWWSPEPLAAKVAFLGLKGTWAQWHWAFSVHTVPMELSILLVGRIWLKSGDDGGDGPRKDLFPDPAWAVAVIMEWMARDYRDVRRDVIPLLFNQFKTINKKYIVILVYSFSMQIFWKNKNTS